MIMSQFERMHIKATGTIQGFARHYFLLYSAVLGVEPDLVFEFGAGFSTQVILCALEDNHRGRLITCDQRSRVQTVEKQLYVLENRLTYLEGTFEKCKIDIGNHFYDIVLHDGSHDWSSVADELNFLIPLIKQNGILMVHDTCHPSQMASTLTPDILQGMPGKLEYMTLPYGYGLTIARVREDFGHGKISPKWRKQ